MMYFLDFDRTIFDTDRFMVDLREDLVAGPLFEKADGNRPLFVDLYVAEPSFGFAPGELSKYLYPDAAGFLREKENGVMIITYGVRRFQEAKVESAITGIPRISTIYTNDVRKGEVIGPHIGMYGTSPVFVDDAPIELEIFSARCPGAQIFEMRRDGGAGDGRWPVIRSLSELP